MKRATGVWIIIGLVVTLALSLVACKPPPPSGEKASGGAPSYLQRDVEPTGTTPAIQPTPSPSPIAAEQTAAVSLTLTANASATAEAWLQSSRTITHTVQEGETLGLLAKTYGVPVATLAALNSIENPDFIRVGQILSVSVPAHWTPPATATSPPEPTATSTPPGATATPSTG